VPPDQWLAKLIRQQQIEREWLEAQLTWAENVLKALPNYPLPEGIQAKLEDHLTRKITTLKTDLTDDTEDLSTQRDKVLDEQEDILQRLEDQLAAYQANLPALTLLREALLPITQAFPMPKNIWAEYLTEVRKDPCEHTIAAGPECAETCEEGPEPEYKVPPPEA